MCQILDKIRNVDPNNSEVVKDVLTVFFQNLSKHVKEDCNSWLRSLEGVLCRFPKYVVSQRNNLEKYLSNFLDSTNFSTVIGAAKCAQALQQVKTSHDKAATPKVCWRDQMNLLCKVAHNLLDVLFPKAVDMYRNSTDEQEMSGSSPLSSALVNITVIHDENQEDKMSIIQTRLRNVFVFIQAMLVEVYPVAKPVQPHTILNLILRSLSVTSGSNNSGISSIKIQALRTLDALIACLGSNLIIFSPLVIRLAMQTLRWSSDNPSEEASKVRCTAYNSLCAWLNTLSVHRTNGQAWEDELASHITDDITPDYKQVQLTIGQPTRNLSRKARKKLAKTMLKESSIAAHMPGEKNKVQLAEETNNEVAIAALNCAETFLIVCGRFLKPATHKLFHERLVRECYRVAQHPSSLLLPLLRALEAGRKSAPTAVPPPTQYCLHLYTMLLHTGEANISMFCSQALLDIRLHLHCSPPSLNFAVEVAQEQISHKRKKMSDRNKAVLESLLGVDRMPPENSNDIIAIQDEPSSKKPRLEEDKISVSSESVSSIEISDDSDENDVQEVQVTVEINDTRENDLDDQASDDINVANGEMQITKDIVDDNVPTTKDKGTDNTDTEKAIGDSNVEKIADSGIINPQDAVDGENVVESDILHSENLPIYDATTQVPMNVSNETFDGDERQSSLEVGYDYPNTGTDKIVLEKMEDENLPSSNDTDDIQITCGQVVKCSQDNLIENSNEGIEEGLKTNEIDKVVENGIDDKCVNVDTDSKIPAKKDEISVEDMLADFVDEVNEEIKT